MSECCPFSGGDGGGGGRCYLGEGVIDTKISGFEVKKRYNPKIGLILLGLLLLVIVVGR